MTCLSVRFANDPSAGPTVIHDFTVSNFTAAGVGVGVGVGVAVGLTGRKLMTAGPVVPMTGPSH
jgi:hypothetical protein